MTDDLAIENAARAATAPMPKAPFPIVVIGAGGIVHDAHLPAYRQAGFPVAALVDADAQKAAALAQQFGISLATDSLEQAIHKSPQRAIFDLAVPAGAILLATTPRCRGDQPLRPAAAGQAPDLHLGERKRRR